MALSADLLRGYTETIILSFLAEGDSYGYAINRRLSEVNGGAELKEATLYTALRRLETAGLILSFWGDELRGARRRYYRITPAGILRLAEDRETWKTTRNILDRLILEGEHDE